MNRQWKRTLSIVLSLAMLFSMTGMNTVLAVEGTPPGLSALCEHHSEHTTDCGYIEGTPETPCAHEHGDECYKEVTRCVHEHTEDYYDNAVETASESNAREPVNCSHICDEESGCVTEKLDCHHEHNGDCSYAPVISGTPCLLECEKCKKDSGNPPANQEAEKECDCTTLCTSNSVNDDCPVCGVEAADLSLCKENEQPSENNGIIKTVTGFPGFDGSGPLLTIEVAEKSTAAAIGLQGTVKASVEGEPEARDIPVTWDCADDYENTEYETYDFTAVLDGGYRLAEGMTDLDLPYITVKIAGMENPLVKGTGDVVTAADLKAALEADTSATINVTEDITLEGAASLLMVAMGADHTLNISSGKILTIGGGTGNNDAALINLNGHTLTVTGGNGGTRGKVLINNFGSNGIYGYTGTLNLENVQVEVTNLIQGGLGNIQILNIKDGVTVTLNGDGDSLMQVNDGQTVTVETGGSVTITKGSITLYGGTLHINGGAVHVNSGPNRGIWTSDGSTLKLSGSGTLDGTGTIALYQRCTVEGLGGKFTDREAKLTESGAVTVGMPSVSPAASGLTQGDYSWDAGSNTFSKSGYTVSGTVTDSRGNGISGAAVTLEYWYLATAYEAGTATTGADGSYTFSNISASFYSTGNVGKIYDQDYRIKASKDGCAEIAGEMFSVEDNHVTGKDITLPPGSGATTYAVVVIGGTASPTTAAQGEAVTITANAAPSGQRFKEWTTSQFVTFTDGTSKTDAIAKFTMPGQAVTATAVYDDITVDTSAIDTAISAANAAKAGITTSDSAASSVANGTKFVTTAEMSVLNDAISAAQAAKGTVTTTAQAQAAAQTLNAATAAFKAAIKTGTYTEDTSGGDSGDGGSTTSAPTVTIPNAAKPNPPTDAKTAVKATVDNTGKATATVPEKSVTDALKTAQDAAKKNGTEKNGISVTLDLITDKAASSVAVALPANSINELVKAGVTELRIESSTGDIRLDLAALKAIQAAGAGNVVVSMNRADAKGLPAEAQKAIGNRPVFALSIMAGGKAITSFGVGSVTAALPYTLQAGEKAGNLVGVYVDDAGKLIWLTNSSYEPQTKMLMFATSHFSTFGIGYKQDAPTFTDTTGHWAKDDIDFVASRGLLGGTSTTTFSPNTGLTRGMFVTALWRLAGTPQAGEGSAFTDVPTDSYYADAVKWASELGINSGTSATTFSPDKNITRQELATLMVNYAKAMKYTLPKTREAITFADNANIGSWAVEAVRAMQMAGVMNSKNDNKFDPTGTVTRAEVAVTIHRYVDLVIDPATAQGWTKNDVGQWLYYEDGKLATSWKLVDGKWYYLDMSGLMQSGGWKKIGGKWYYLYADGSMAVSTTIDEFEVGSDGARKES